MDDFQTVACVDDIPDGEGRCYEINDRVIAVFNIDGKFSAIDDLCPHMGASLSTGHLDKQTCTVTCPWHGWRFHVQNGSWADNPRVKTDVFQVRVVENQIQVAVNPTAANTTREQDKNDTTSIFDKSGD